MFILNPPITLPQIVSFDLPEIRFAGPRAATASAPATPGQVTLDIHIYGADGSQVLTSRITVCDDPGESIGLTYNAQAQTYRDLFLPKAIGIIPKGYTRLMGALKEAPPDANTDVAFYVGSIDGWLDPSIQGASQITTPVKALIDQVLAFIGT